MDVDSRGQFQKAACEGLPIEIKIQVLRRICSYDDEISSLFVPKPY